MDPAIKDHTPKPFAHEQAALDARRACNDSDTHAPAIGLALSGGGVRSATFCLGLLRALAKNGVLLRFDYLSTVSGGGYVGAALGRLFRPGVKPEQVERGLANDRSILLWWLRANGRYLLPEGMHDLMQTWAGQLRGFIATQFEISLVILLISCVAVLPHLLVFELRLPAALLMGSTLWWKAVPMAIWTAIFMAFAYWWSRDSEDGNPAIDWAICAAALLAGGYLMTFAFSPWLEQGRLGRIAIACVLLAVPASFAWRHIGRMPSAEARVRYTVGLSTALKVAVLFWIIGAADLVSWFLAYQIKYDRLQWAVLKSAALGAMFVALARFALPMLQSPGGKKSLSQLPLALMANLCGVVLLALLTLFWLTTLQFFVFFSDPSPTQTWMHWLTSRLSPAAQSVGLEAWLRWLTIAVPSLAFVLLTGGNLQQINRSSLHAFYRSRLARSYVSVGNAPPATGTTRFPASPLQTKSPGSIAHLVKLTELLPGDDIDLLDYTPHEYGGPIHLINCCINQTIDDRTGTYNADRKGICLTVSALGIETGSKFPEAPAPMHPLADTTLAEWIAISGAAAGSGMGSMTRVGTAILFFLSGFRLGYWWKHRVDVKDRWWSRLGKSRAAVQEMLARFPGLQSPVWYLSDGGHFDNSGVYSLLKRRLPLIVLADCGADPMYVFADLENLIRKARIDLGATIEFINPESLGVIAQSLRDRFGTPDSIEPEPGDQHLLLARIVYRNGSHGCMLVVKPRLCCELPLDVAGYADRHRDFPQQSTVEQFFNETQWESYCQLGEVLGAPIDAALLAMLPALARNGVAVRANAICPGEPKNALTRRQRIGATIGASLSLGALATVAVTGWKAWDSHHSDAQGNRQALSAARRTADSLQTDLEAGVPYDTAMHGRIFELMEQLNAGGHTPDLVVLVHRLATMQGVCDRVVPGDMHDRCLFDFYALGAADAENKWHESVTNYRAWFTLPSPAYPRTPSAPLSDVAQAAINHCGGSHRTQPPLFTVYTKIYDEKSRKEAVGLTSKFIGLGLAAVNEIKDFGAPADDLGQGSPNALARPVFLYSSFDPGAQACAQALAAWLHSQPTFQTRNPAAIPLPVKLQGNPAVIEFWLLSPPKATAQGTTSIF